VILQAEGQIFLGWAVDGAQSQKVKGISGDVCYGRKRRGTRPQVKLTPDTSKGGDCQDSHVARKEGVVGTTSKTPNTISGGQKAAKGVRFEEKK